MTALTADREDGEQLQPNGPRYSYPVDAGAVINQGAIVVVDTADGLAKEGATSTTLIAVGVAEARADNTGGADGAIEVSVATGVFGMKNSAAADEIELDDLGKTCFIVDDQTVALTDGTATRSKAGLVADVDNSGSTGTVFVEMGPTVQAN